MQVDRLVSASLLCVWVLSICIAAQNSPRGVFLLNPRPTLFWAAFFAPQASLVAQLTQDAELWRLAVLAAGQLCLGHAFLYGGALAFWEFQPYVLALVAALLSAAPGAFRLYRGERAHACGALGLVSVVLGTALCCVAAVPQEPAPVSHTSEALALFSGIWSICTGGVAALASHTRQPRAIRFQKLGWSLSVTFLISTSAMTGARGSGYSRNAIISIASGLCLFNALAGGAVGARLSPPEVAIPTEPLPLPPTGRTRFAELKREAELAVIADEEAAHKEG
jgi:hypothetical protein